MNFRKIFTCVCAASGMFVLILDGKTALLGARDGIGLCVRTLIPSLFPYLVLSALLTGSLTGGTAKLLRPMERLTGMPGGTGGILAVGLLGGYPAGALNLALAQKQGRISGMDAERLLAFCNNAGPAFLFGIMGPMFSQPRFAWILWLIHIFSALAVGIITANRPAFASSGHRKSISLPEALEQGVRTMGLICGWVILFRILLCFLERWFLWMLPTELQVLVCGILELSNGCLALGSIQSEGLRFLLASVMLSLGGLCITMQTASAATPLSLKQYFPGKILQCFISFLACVFFQFLFPPAHRWHCPGLLLTLAAVCTLLLAAQLKRNKKISSIPAIIGV